MKKKIVCGNQQRDTDASHFCWTHMIILSEKNTGK